VSFSRNPAYDASIGLAALITFKPISETAIEGGGFKTCRLQSTYTVLTSVNMMSTATTDPALATRLERLTGEDASCCVPEYQGLAREVAASPRFPVALKRVRALADENRLLAVALLKRRKELCACEIQAATGLTHATVSHHMAALVDAGLVKSRRQGKWMYYRLAERPEVSIP